MKQNTLDAHIQGANQRYYNVRNKEGRFAKLVKNRTYFIGNKAVKYTGANTFLGQ